MALEDFKGRTELLGRRRGFRSPNIELAAHVDLRARLYQDWIANDRRLQALLRQMRQVAGKATELRLKQAADT